MTAAARLSLASSKYLPSCRKPRRAVKRIIISSAILLALGVQTAWATPHSPGQSYILVEVLDERIEGSFEATIRDVNAALGLHLNELGGVTAEDIGAVRERLQEYYLENVSFSVDGKEIPIVFMGHDVLQSSFGQFAVLRFRLEELTTRPEAVDVRYAALLDTSPDHRGVLAVHYDWKRGTLGEEIIAAVFQSGDEHQTLDLSSPSIWRGLLATVRLGTVHIWEGIDHVLFLIALILPAVVRREQREWQPVQGFRPAFIYVLKIVTLFTLAHTITLSLAALKVVELPSRLVESVIAASIVAAAVDIIYPVFGRRIWIVVFGFGLFHGFGFASALSEMGIGREHVGLSLFGFNLGVELGQIGIISLVFPLLFLIRKWSLYNKIVLRGGAFALSAVALLWFFERTLDFNVRLYAMARKLFETVV